jgi:hypothetical protein
MGRQLGEGWLCGAQMLSGEQPWLSVTSAVKEEPAIVFNRG